MMLKPVKRWTFGVAVTGLIGLTLLHPASGLVIQAAIPRESGAYASSTSVSCQGMNGLQCAAFTLDNVSLQIQTPFLPGPFLVSPPGSVSEVATSLAQIPYEELSVTTAPFGATPGTENVPSAAPGGSSSYLAALHDFWAGRQGVFSTAPSIRLFGQPIQGQVSLAYASHPGAVSRTLIVEWVGEAGQRLWLVRVGQVRPPTESTFDATQTFVQSLSSISLSSSNPLAPTSVPVASGSTSASTQVNALDMKLASYAAVPMPSWWTAAPGKPDATCDTGNYALSAPLYTDTYLPSLIPCGPMPGLGYGVATAYFYSGAPPEIEWQCVELAMRWMYQQYAIGPYPVDGGVGVVWQYTGSTLIHVMNDGNYGHETYSYGSTSVPSYGSRGIAPVPGDVVSFTSTSSKGHTGVIVSTNVDSNGNASDVWMVDQNDMTQLRHMTMSNWKLNWS